MRVLCLILICFALPLQAMTREEVTVGFSAWLEEILWPQARDAGVARQTWDRHAAGLKPDWDIPGLVLPGQTVPKRQSQAEFRAPGRYFRHVAGTASAGKPLANRHASVLRAQEKRTGVPGHILLAIWGRESGYGRVSIPHNALTVLATKGRLSTRAEYFQAEFVAALQLIETGAPTPLRSSWAGAIGQAQFTPYNVLEFGTDGDGDGLVDMNDSAGDTLASIATFLGEKGWQRGMDWGFEITPNIACTNTDVAKPIRDWVAEDSITRVSGRPFPAAEMDTEVRLLLPAGTQGPAFLVTPNFFVLKRYNVSDLYALFIGNTGDRIAYGSGDFRTAWQPVDTLLRSEVAQIQSRLIEKGFDTGGADGLPGAKTRRAIGEWQISAGLSPTCFPSRAVFDALQ
ncbi:MAG: peptidoglycan-binding protein [Rhodobacteraceae bacterium]|nr:peptidoglycan-binding protein [Paracoccaceae bacterium]